VEDTKPEKLTKEEKELHKFHRQGLRKEIYQSDPYALGEVKILEYLLTLATARGDTNPLAHKLLNKFGSISNIVNSNYTQLLAIKGIGPKIASFLLSYGKILHFVFETGALPKKKTVLQTINQFSGVLRNYFLGKTYEEFYVLLLTAKSELIGVERITTGNVNSVGIDVPSFVQTVLQHNASIIVIAHNHPDGELQPSGEDIDATLAIVEAISVYGVRVADHLIIGPKQVFSFKNAGLLDQIIEARAHKNHAFSNRLYGFYPNSSGIIDLTPTPFEEKPDYLNPIIDS
jgi:DNA repair protein RadC